MELFHLERLVHIRIHRFAIFACGVFDVESDLAIGHELHPLTHGEGVTVVVFLRDIEVLEELLQAPEGVFGVVIGDLHRFVGEVDLLARLLGQGDIEIVFVHVVLGLENLDGIF